MSLLKQSTLRVRSDRLELVRGIRDLIDAYEQSEDELIDEIAAFIKFSNSRKSKKSKKNSD